LLYLNVRHASRTYGYQASLPHRGQLINVHFQREERRSVDILKQIKD
jgi:hypothetical protein